VNRVARPKATTKKAKRPASGRPPKKTSSKAATGRGPRRAPTTASVTELRVREIESLRKEIKQRSAELLPRWNADPEDVQRSVAQLVLSLVEFLRKLLERQAIRRMEAETLAPTDVERIGLALMRLEETVHDLASRFGLEPEELNLDLGPLGRLT
jgi:hypothetical protein